MHSDTSNSGSKMRDIADCRQPARRCHLVGENCGHRVYYRMFHVRNDGLAQHGAPYRSTQASKLQATEPGSLTTSRPSCLTQL